MRAVLFCQELLRKYHFGIFSLELFLEIVCLIPPYMLTSLLINFIKKTKDKILFPQRYAEF